MSFVRVTVKPDTLDDENLRFEQRPLDRPLFLNSVPKSGSHLLRNIIRMFVPAQDQYRAEFIQHHFIQQHLAAFDPQRNMLSWGHLFYMEQFRSLLANVRHIVLVRDPYQWVLARARFVLSNEFQGGLDHLKDPDFPVDALIKLMVEGTRPHLAPLSVTYEYNALLWLDAGVHLVRYEDLVAALRRLDDDGAEAYFSCLLGACGIAKPEDWRERVRIGSDPAQSGTARENLTGVADRLPAELSEEQKQMVDDALPGLRTRLGYG